MASLKSIVLFAAALYVGFVGLLYVFQRGIMYFPDRARTPPFEAGFPEAREEILASGDGETLVVWHVPPREGRRVVLYFQGNGGALRLRAPRFRGLVADGTGLLALSYRGYGGSSGRPTEAGLIADAHALHAFASARYAPERLALWGESLGGGVAIALAAEKPVGRIVLEAPFTSAADVASAAYPFAPVRLLMKDQFRSDERIGAVTAPVLVIHGARDRTVPFRLGERLYGMIRSEKRFVRLPEAGHHGLDQHGALAHAKQFLEE